MAEPAPQQNPLGLLEKLGGRIGSVIACAGGLLQIIDAAPDGKLKRIASGIVWVGAGLALFFHDRRAQSMQKMYVTREAEKSVSDSGLPTSSAVPQIQREIEKQTNGDPELQEVAAKVQSELVDFNPDTLTPERIMAALRAAVPDRIQSAVWVNVLTGAPDTGSRIQVFRKQRFDAAALLGFKTFGASLGYQFLVEKNLAASVFAGAAHPYQGTLYAGWAPVLGLSVKF